MVCGWSRVNEVEGEYSGMSQKVSLARARKTSYSIVVTLAFTLNSIETMGENDRVIELTYILKGSL